MARATAEKPFCSQDFILAPRRLRLLVARSHSVSRLRPAADSGVWCVAPGAFQHYPPPLIFKFANSRQNGTLCERPTAAEVSNIFFSRGGWNEGSHTFYWTRRWPGLPRRSLFVLKGSYSLLVGFASSSLVATPCRSLAHSVGLRPTPAWNVASGAFEHYSIESFSS